ncbi:MAG: potassium transporter, partial [Pseudohongiella sp.]
MHASIIVKILGLLLMLFSALSNFLPFAVSLGYGDGMAMVFINSFLITFIIGLVLFLPTAR